MYSEAMEHTLMVFSWTCDARSSVRHSSQNGFTYLMARKQRIVAKTVFQSLCYFCLYCVSNWSRSCLNSMFQNCLRLVSNLSLTYLRPVSDMSQRCLKPMPNLSPIFLKLISNLRTVLDFNQMCPK